jgi:hypothetical protein
LEQQLKSIKSNSTDNNETLTKEEISTLESCIAWRNSIVHRGIWYEENAELRATQALILLIRIASDLFALPLPRFSDDPIDPTNLEWITSWRNYHPNLVSKHVKKRGAFKEIYRKHILANPAEYFDQVIRYSSATRIMELKDICRHYDLDLAELTKAIERNFIHLVISSGKGRLHNSIRSLRQLRGHGLCVYADSFAVLLPLNKDLVKEALKTLDKIELKFFASELYRSEHHIEFDSEIIKKKDEKVVDMFIEYLDIVPHTLDEEKKLKLSKLLENFPKELRDKIKKKVW